MQLFNPLCKLNWKEGAFRKKNGGVLWCTSPRALRWEFKRDFEELTITITEYKDYYLREGEQFDKGILILKTTCSFQEFVGCVVKELDRVIKERGILGYRQQWQRDTFPLDGFLALKHAYLYNKPFEFTKKNSGTSLEEEIKLLLVEI